MRLFILFVASLAGVGGTLLLTHECRQHGGTSSAHPPSVNLSTSRSINVSCSVSRNIKYLIPAVTFNLSNYFVRIFETCSGCAKVTLNVSDCVTSILLSTDMDSVVSSSYVILCHGDFSNVDFVSAVSLGDGSLLHLYLFNSYTQGFHYQCGRIRKIWNIMVHEERRNVHMYSQPSNEPPNFVDDRFEDSGQLTDIDLVKYQQFVSNHLASTITDAVYSNVYHDVQFQTELIAISGSSYQRLMLVLYYIISAMREVFLIANDCLNNFHVLMDILITWYFGIYELIVDNLMGYRRYVIRDFPYNYYIMYDVVCNISKEWNNIMIHYCCDRIKFDLNINVFGHLLEYNRDIFESIADGFRYIISTLVKRAGDTSISVYSDYVFNCFDIINSSSGQFENHIAYYNQSTHGAATENRLLLIFLLPYPGATVPWVVRQSLLSPPYARFSHSQFTELMGTAVLRRVLSTLVDRGQSFLWIAASLRLSIVKHSSALLQSLYSTCTNLAWLKTTSLNTPHFYTSHNSPLGCNMHSFSLNWFFIASLGLLSVLTISVFIMLLLFVQIRLSTRPPTISHHHVHFHTHHHQPVNIQTDRHELTNERHMNCAGPSSYNWMKMSDLAQHKPPRNYISDITVMMINNSTIEKGAHSEAPATPPTDKSGTVKPVEITVNTLTNTDDTDNKSSSDSDRNDNSDEERQPPRSTSYLGIPAHSMPTSSRETTPDRKIENRIRSVSWGGKVSENPDISDYGGDVSSTSVSSSQSKPNKRDNWIREDGITTLDKGQSCHVGYIGSYVEQDSANNMMSELSAAIRKTCSPVNSSRVKIELGHGLLINHSDLVNINKKTGKPKRNVKVSELSVNLDEDHDLTRVIKSYQKKVSKSIKEILSIDVEFDHTKIHKITNANGSIPYENASLSENSSFSPVVAVLTLGLGHKTSRPIYMKTTPGNMVTHKIALTNGSLCVFSGRTEVRYRHSLPKDFGQDEEQYFIFFVQRTPDSSILSELLKIEIPPKSEFEKSATSPPETKHRSLNSSAKGEEVDNDNDSTKMSQVPIVPDFKSHYTFTTDNNVTSVHLTTPPTVKRVVDMKHGPDDINFKDAMDFELSGGLILAESLASAIDHMDVKTLDKELVRNQTSIAGSTQQKQKRLKHRLSMNIGEITSAAQNASINLPKFESPGEDNIGTIRNELEAVTNSQTCIENTLKLVVDSIVNIDKSVTDIQAEKKESELTKTSPLPIKKDDLRNVQNSLKEVTEKVEGLTRHIQISQEDLVNMSEEIVLLKESTVKMVTETLEEMQGWHTSVFSDESHEKIKEIHDWVCLQVQRSTSTISPEGEQIISDSSQSEEATLSNMATIEEEVQVPPVAHPQEAKTVPWTVTPTAFTWPDRIQRYSLKTSVLSRQQIDVCLITDSIMRHVNDIDLVHSQHRLRLQRIDRSGTSALSQNKLKKFVVENSPHIIYLHLGINDVHKGMSCDETMENIAKFDAHMYDLSKHTKIVFSAPLLNGQSHHDRAVLRIREAMVRYIDRHEMSSNPEYRRMYLQDNSNLLVKDQSETTQNKVYFKEEDPVHLSARGKRSIICNMRHSLHLILREFLIRA